MYLWVAAAFAAINLVWVMLVRFEGSRRLEQSLRQHTAPKPYWSLPGSGTALRITQFYADRFELTQGEHAIVCYGLENASRARMEPPGEDLALSWNRCISVEPETSTTYNLIAESDGGKRVTASLTLNVKPAPPHILFLAASEKKIVRGDAFTVCYGVKYASAVRLEPVAMKLAAGPQNCVRLYPKRTMEFTLVATGVGGRTDREKVTVQVQ